MPFRRALLIVLALVLLVPCGAQAATVSVAGGTLTVTAAPGEANRLTVRPATGEVLDPRAPLVAGSGWAGGGAGRLVCTVPARVVATLGDGDDTFLLSGAAPATVDDGPGNDA